MLIKYKDRIFNTAAITTADKNVNAAIPRAIAVLKIKFVDGSEALFTGADAPKVWQLLCAAAKTPSD